jgi:hypothetical protein
MSCHGPGCETLAPCSGVSVSDAGDFMQECNVVNEVELQQVSLRVYSVFHC